MSPACDSDLIPSLSFFQKFVVGLELWKVISVYQFLSVELRFFENLKKNTSARTEIMLRYFSELSIQRNSQKPVHSISNTDKFLVIARYVTDAELLSFLEVRRSHLFSPRKRLVNVMVSWPSYYLYDTGDWALRCNFTASMIKSRWRAIEQCQNK